MLSAFLLSTSLVHFTPIQETDYGKTWDEVTRAISSRFYARQRRKDEMEALFKKYESPAKAAKSREDFSKVVNQMIADFKDSHFAFMTNDSQGYYLMDNLAKKDSAPMAEIGAWFRPIPTGGGYTVQMVLDGTEAQKAGLRKGDVITLINGKPFTPVASLRENLDKASKISYQRNGKTFEATVTPEEKPALKMFLDATRDSAKIIEVGGKKVGYVHLWTEANTDFRDTLASLVYGKLRDTDALILDNRDGFGGRPEGFLDPFFRPEVNIEWKFSETAPGMQQLFGYQRPLVMLINEGSRSAKEVTSMILKKSGRGTLVGSTTAGHVLGTSPFRLNDWSYLEIPIVDVIVDGVRIEGKGVEPDVKLPRESDEAGNDLHIQAAMDLLGRKLGVSK